MIRLRTNIVRAAAVVLIGCSIQQAAHAQGNAFGAGRPSAPYRHQQQLSPYLDLLRSDNSVLSPYHTFVRPRREVRRALNQQASDLHRLERATIGSHSTSRRDSSSRLPTGRGGTFHNYLHYYRSGPRSHVR